MSAVLFDRLVRSSFGSGAAIGSLWFAVATVTNLIVGRVTFGLGVTFALASVYPLSRKHPFISIGAALLAGLASPVAGLFLAIACAAWGWARPRVRVTAWSAMAAAFLPVLAIAVVFPSPGAEPYEWWALGCDLALCLAALAVVPMRFAALRWAAVIYAVVLLATKLVESPLGGNVSRLNQYAAGPLLVCVLWEHRRHLVVLVAIPLVFWQWFPATDAILRAPSDPSTHRGVLPAAHQLAHRERDRLRTGRDPRHVPALGVGIRRAGDSCSRGWERQLDYAYAEEFYDGTLTTESYREWLRSNGVAYVALPDTQLDASSHVEADIIRSGPSYLEHVWTGPHWQVWQFTGYRGLVDGPARMAELNADSFLLDVRAPGAVTVRVHYSPRWAVDGDGCTVETPNGWTRIENLQPGSVRVSQALRGTRCDEGSRTG